MSESLSAQLLPDVERVVVKPQRDKKKLLGMVLVCVLVIGSVAIAVGVTQSNKSSSSPAPSNGNGAGFEVVTSPFVLHDNLPNQYLHARLTSNGDYSNITLFRSFAQKLLPNMTTLEIYLNSTTNENYVGVWENISGAIIPVLVLHASKLTNGTATLQILDQFFAYQYGQPNSHADTDEILAMRKLQNSSYWQLFPLISWYFGLNGVSGKSFPLSFSLHNFAMHAARDFLERKHRERRETFTCSQLTADSSKCSGSGYIVDENDDPDCVGLCGPGCCCWHMVCGDCCAHPGCMTHDLACARSYFTWRCLTAYGVIWGKSSSPNMLNC